MPVESRRYCEDGRTRRDGRQTTSIDNPILNSPYEQPDRHFEIGPNGPTGRDQGRPPAERVLHPDRRRRRRARRASRFRRRSTSTSPANAGSGTSLINEIRRDVAKWRSDGQYGGVTPITRKLLQHWADPDRENRVHLLPARGRRDGDLPGRGRGPAPRVRRLAPAARARERGSQRRAAASGPEDGDRRRQDRRDGDAHRLADPQQGAVAARRALHQPVPRRHARASRSATGSACCCPRTRELLRPARPDPRRPQGRPRAGAHRRSRTTTPSSSRTPRRSGASPRTRASC